MATKTKRKPMFDPAVDKRFAVMSPNAPDAPWTTEEFDSFAEASACLASHQVSYTKTVEKNRRPYLVQRW